MPKEENDPVHFRSDAIKRFIKNFNAILSAYFWLVQKVEFIPLLEID